MSNGVPLLASRGEVVTLECVQKLQSSEDEEEHEDEDEKI